MAKYYVDESDAPYPVIKIYREGYLAAWVKPLTLAEAKAEIIRHAESNRDHWRWVIASTRALRASDIQEN
jgi:hypothetical protein